MFDVKSKILYILEKDLGLTLDSYDDRLELDSLDEVWLVMYLEEDFKISIPGEDIEGLDTVNKIMRYINEKHSIDKEIL